MNKTPEEMQEELAVNWDQIAEQQERIVELERERDCLMASMAKVAPMIECWRSRLCGGIGTMDGEETEAARAADKWLQESLAASLAALRAEHWREAWDWIQADVCDDFGPEEIEWMKSKIESIERGEP